MANADSVRQELLARGWSRQMVGGRCKMARQRAKQLNYMVSIYDDPDAIGALRFTFVPKSVQHAHAEKKPPQPVPQYIISVQALGDETKFKWLNPPAREETREELEALARERVSARGAWLEKL